MLEIQPGRFVLKSRESLHGRELDVVVDSLTAVSYTHLDVYKRQGFKVQVA